MTNFQEDSAPVHLAFNTVQLLQCKTFNFLSPELLPPLTVQNLTLLAARGERMDTVQCSYLRHGGYVFVVVCLLATLCKKKLPNGFA